MEVLCVILRPDNEDAWIEHHGIANYQEAPSDQILDTIRNAGISGLGGAGFPTAVKLAPQKPENIDTLIINGTECEPYITADDMLMRERADQIIAGIEIVFQLLKPKICIFGIEDNKPEAIQAINTAINEADHQDWLKVATFPTKYPSGGEKQLIQILTGQEVPSGGIPADIGIVCQNVGTVYAVYRAVALGEPLISRITTLTGEACGNKGNYETLIGTPVEHLMDVAKVDRKHLSRLIMGGPMMGFTLSNTAVPVVKTTNCLIAGTQKELPTPPPAQACIRCGHCAEACPADLLPQQLYWFSRSKEFDKAKDHNLLDCIECGACSYVCPSHIPLVQYYRFAKGEIRNEEVDAQKSEHAKQRYESRIARFEREKAEKEAKRLARLEASKAKKAAADADTENNEPKDEKQALIAAALARTAAKKGKAPANTSTDTADFDKLQHDFDKAKEKYEKAQDRLADGKANNPDMVPALEVSLERFKAKYDQTKQALEAAKQTESNAPSSNNEQLQSSSSANVIAPQTSEDAFAALNTEIQKLEARIEKATTRVEDAKAENSPHLKPLEKNLAKLQFKLTEATQKLADLKPTVQPQATESVIMPEVSVASNQASSDKVNARAKLLERIDKAKIRLDEAIAESSPYIKPLESNLEKLKVKLEALGPVTENDTTSNAQSSNASDALQTKNVEAPTHQISERDKLLERIQKAQARLDEAVAESSPYVKPLENNLNKLKTKLESLSQADQ